MYIFDGKFYRYRLSQMIPSCPGIQRKYDGRDVNAEAMDINSEGIYQLQ